MSKLISILIAIIFSLAANISSISADEYSSEAENLFKKLISGVKPVNGYLWPPVLEFNSDSVPNVGVKVFYSPEKDKIGFKTYISKGVLIKLTKDNPSLLSFILSHEIAHIIKGHIANEKNSTILIQNALSKDEEYVADSIGLKLALDAGSNYKDIVLGLRFLVSIEQTKSPYDCLSSNHPAWSERLSRIDCANKEIWRSLAIFDNGITFLSLNQYDAAIYCFHYILNQFPDCYEANVNIGYAALMKYIEGFDIDNFRNLNSGLFISGNYYKCSPSLKSRIRGIDEDLWWIAVGEFQTALRLKPNLTMAKANLGLAYLIGPNPRSSVGKAAKYLTEALELAETDTTIDAMAKANIYMNAGLSFIETDSSALSSNPFIIQAEELSRQFTESFDNIKDYKSGEFECALKYNKAQMLIRMGNKEQKNEAVSLLASFLESSDTESPWWDIGLNQYLQLCTELAISPSAAIVNRKSIKTNNEFKKVIRIETNNKNIITLSDNKDVLISKFRKYNMTEHTIIPGKNLKRLRFDELGIELFAADYIFAIILNSESSPKIILEKNHRNSGTRIYVGMPVKDFELTLGSSQYIDKTGLICNGDAYRYYYNIGIAVKFNNKTKTVQELVIVQL